MDFQQIHFVVAGTLVLLTRATILMGEITDSGPRSPPSRLIFEQIPVSNRPFDSKSYAAGGLDLETQIGSRIVVLDGGTRKQEVVVLTPDFAAAGRPDLSFDGRRVLFVGKRERSGPMGIWEMGIDGGDVREIIRLSTDCMEARYLSTIYSLDAERPEYQLCFCRADDRGISAAYTCRMDGTGVRQITFDPHGVRDPLPLSDSRLLLSFQRPGNGASARHDQATDNSVLCTINTDGTDLSAFAVAQGPSAARRMPCEMPDGRIAFVESGAGPMGRGATLIAVSRTRRFPPRQVLASDPDGNFLSPSPLADESLLVSYHSKDAVSYGIYVVDLSRGAQVVHIYDSPQWHDVRAVALRPRAEPAGRSSQIDEQADYGYLYALNSYLSDTPEGQRTQAGQIKQVEVFKAVTTRRERAAGTGFAADLVHEESLGKAPVEADGSLFLKVPARTALRLRTLDAEGNALQTMRSWFWVMPKEGRGCIGCHEDRERTPPNRHVLALRRPPDALGVAPDAAVETGPTSLPETANYP